MKKLAFLFLPLLLIGCTEDSDRTDTKPVTPPVQKVKVPAFNQDSAYYFIEKQVSFGPRVPNSQAHRMCSDWMVQVLKQYNLKVTEQKFQATAYDGTTLSLVNIIAEFKPEAQKRILLAAHWDSRHVADRDSSNSGQPIAGANDGGSGVGVLLELARVITTNNPTIGVDLILFDGEDYGQPEETDFPYMQDSWCFGSQYWSKNKHKANYYPNYGILLDMVGAENAQFAKEGVSRYYANNIVEKVWKHAQNSGYGNYFSNTTSEQIVDDHKYVNEIGQIPMIDIIEYAPNSSNGGYFGNYHHTHSDNMEVINKNTLKAVGQTLLEVIYNE